MPWYGGEPLLAHLETVPLDRVEAPARLPVQYVIRGERRLYAGQVAAGALRVGDEVAVLPGGARSRVAAIEGPAGPLEEAPAPLSVAVALEDELDVSRGDLIAPVADAPAPVRELAATLCWLGDAPARPGGRYLLKHAARTVRAKLDAIDAPARPARRSTAHLAGELALNDLARVRLRLGEPLAADPYADSRATGAFILIDEATNDTVAAGMVEGVKTANTRWHDGAVTPADRAAALGFKGATIWFTGLPASGKSTLAVEIEALLIGAGRPALRLDGDNLRHGLNGDLGFSAEDRAENVRRTAHAAALLAEAGVVALVALVSPYASDRATARAIHEAAGRAVPRGLGLDRAGGVRAARPEGPLRAGPGRRAAGPDRRGRRLRGPGVARSSTIGDAEPIPGRRRARPRRARVAGSASSRQSQRAARVTLAVSRPTTRSQASSGRCLDARPRIGLIRPTGLRPPFTELADGPCSSTDELLLSLAAEFWPVDAGRRARPARRRGAPLFGVAALEPGRPRAPARRERSSRS